MLRAPRNHLISIPTQEYAVYHRLHCTGDWGSLEEMGTKEMEKSVRLTRTLEKENDKEYYNSGGASA